MVASEGVRVWCVFCTWSSNFGGDLCLFLFRKLEFDAVRSFCERWFGVGEESVVVFWLRWRELGFGALCACADFQFRHFGEVSGENFFFGIRCCVVREESLEFGGRWFGACEEPVVVFWLSRRELGFGVCGWERGGVNCGKGWVRVA